jgi:hypothetical protein
MTYKFSVDASYYRAVTDRYYRQRPFLLRLPVQFGLLSLILTCLFLWTTNSSLRDAVIAAPVIVLLVLVGGVSLTKHGILWRFRNRADFGTEVTVTLSDAGLAASGPNVKGRWEWAAYPSAVRYADGILLLRRGAIRWLPDGAIQDATPAQATALVQSKTVLKLLA